MWDFNLFFFFFFTVGGFSRFFFLKELKTLLLPNTDKPKQIIFSHVPVTSSKKKKVNFIFPKLKGVLGKQAMCMQINA